MTDRTALITGGAGDIGIAIATRFLADGGRVVIVDRTEQVLDDALARLGGVGEVSGVVADVTDGAAVAHYVGEAQERLGHIDAFFNNAGIEGDATPIVDYPYETFRRVLAVNVEGVFLGLKHVLPVMIARGSGAVVNSASVSGLRGAELLSGYSASKHAVIGLTRTAAVEVGPAGVRVNAICPSAVGGRMIQSIADQSAPGAGDEAIRGFEARNPLGRMSTPDEIASVATFLASDEASFVNGAAWVIDGGRSVR